SSGGPWRKSTHSREEANVKYLGVASSVVLKPPGAGSIECSRSNSSTKIRGHSVERNTWAVSLLVCQVVMKVNSPVTASLLLALSQVWVPSSSVKACASFCHFGRPSSATLLAG